MWPVIVGVLSLGLAILALIGLLTVAKELFGDSSLDANFTDAADRHHIGGDVCGRRRVITR
jgi:hypothetical protein